MKDATLCYIFENNKVLLQKKARGFGEGKWNAPGGKIKILESAERAAVREVREETGLCIEKIKKSGILHFKEESGKSFSVHVFSAKEFSGYIRESEEGKLKWFDIKSVPYDEMWEDDKIWLPYLLGNKRFKGAFLFTEGFKKMIKHKIETLEDSYEEEKSN